jgi:hypothetical protein
MGRGKRRAFFPQKPGKRAEERKKNRGKDEKN